MAEIKMRVCNVCQKEKKDSKFKHENKKTCVSCEFRWKTSFLRLLVKDKRLNPKERLSNRIGYMGSAFIMLSPYLLKYDNIGAITYIVGALLLTPQVFLAKQWNIVILNLNIIIGYLIYIIS
jgi:hypothetical protein